MGPFSARSVPRSPPRADGRRLPQGRRGSLGGGGGKRAELERQAVEKLEGRLLDALDTYLEVVDNQGAPDQARLAAADRIVERLIGKVGEGLMVHKEQRAEVTVRLDVERLAGVVQQLRNLGAIEGEAEPGD
jgi:hypothetical protein